MKKSELTEIIREVIKETIRKVDGKYVVYPEKGGKRLGTHSSRKAAEKQLTAIHLNKEAVDTDNMITVVSIIQPRERKLDDEYINQLFDGEIGGTFYIYIREGELYEELRPVSRQDALRYMDYYNAAMRGQRDKAHKISMELRISGYESELRFNIGEFKTDPSFFSANENYADGEVKGKSRPGRVKKAGASCKGSVTDLRAKAKKYGGEKGKMYHWCANMKAGRKK